MDENNIDKASETAEAVQNEQQAQPRVHPQTTEPVNENVVAGIVGAFLFSLAGGALWYVLYQVGFIAGISAIVGVIAAIKGYEIFAKKIGLRGVIISVVIAAAVIVIAWYLCLSTDLYNVWNGEWYVNRDVPYQITFFDAVRMAYTFLSEPEIAQAYLVDLGIGILFGVLGCIQPVREAVAKSKPQQK